MGDSTALVVPGGGATALQKLKIEKLTSGLITRTCKPEKLLKELVVRFLVRRIRTVLSSKAIYATLTWDILSAETVSNLRGAFESKTHEELQRYMDINPGTAADMFEKYTVIGMFKFARTQAEYSKALTEHLEKKRKQKNAALKVLGMPNPGEEAVDQQIHMDIYNEVLEALPSPDAVDKKDKGAHFAKLVQDVANILTVEDAWANLEIHDRAKGKQMTTLIRTDAGVARLLCRCYADLYDRVHLYNQKSRLGITYSAAFDRVWSWDQLGDPVSDDTRRSMLRILLWVVSHSQARLRVWPNFASDDATLRGMFDQKEEEGLRAKQARVQMIMATPKTVLAAIQKCLGKHERQQDDPSGQSTSRQKVSEVVYAGDMDKPEIPPPMLESGKFHDAILYFKLYRRLQKVDGPLEETYDVFDATKPQIPADQVLDMLKTLMHGAHDPDADQKFAYLYELLRKGRHGVFLGEEISAETVDHSKNLVELTNKFAEVDQIQALIQNRNAAVMALESQPGVILLGGPVQDPPPMGSFYFSPDTADAEMRKLKQDFLWFHHMRK